MKRSRFNAEQIIAIFQEHAAGESPADLLRRHSISRQTFYGWKRQYGTLQVPEAKGLKALGGKCAAQAPRGKPAEEMCSLIEQAIEEVEKSPNSLTRLRFRSPEAGTTLAGL